MKLLVNDMLKILIDNMYSPESILPLTNKMVCNTINNSE